MGNEINSDNMKQPEEYYHGVPVGSPYYRFQNYYPGKDWEKSNLIICFPEKYSKNDLYTPNYKLGMLLIDFVNEETQSVYKMDELGTMAGVSRQSIQKYITSKKKGEFDYTEIPMQVLVNLSRNLGIPLAYFTDNSIPYTENPKNIFVRRDYYHRIPLRPYQSKRGVTYLGDLCQTWYDHSNQSTSLKAKGKLSEIEEKAGLTPQLVNSLDAQSIDLLTSLIRKAVGNVICDIREIPDECDE